MTSFQEAILRVVQLIPAGKVMSYGQVAACIGAPLAARQVGWAMRSLEPADNFPWWRVLNNAGKITIKGNMHATADLQKELLQAEGILISDSYQLDIETYRFRPSTQQLQSLRLDYEYLRRAAKEYPTE